MKHAKKLLALVLVFALLLPYIGRPATAVETEAAGENAAATEAAETKTATNEEDTDSSIPVLQLGQSQTAKVAGGEEEAWFRFTPEADGYYFFTSNIDADTHATLYDADKNYLQSDDDGGDGANFRIVFHAVAGETYYFSVRFLNNEAGSFPVVLTESPVASITVNPVTLTELSGGWWEKGYNPETETEEPYYCYGWWNHMSYTVTMKNGDTVTGIGVFFQYNGQEYKLDFSDGQSPGNFWTGGNSYQGTVSFGSVSTEVSITIEESPVASITANPVTLTELSGGWWDKGCNPETGTEEPYYCYGWWNYMSYTVTMKNGDTVTESGMHFQYDGREYKLEFSDGQSTDNPWTVGNTYPGTVSFGSVSTEVSITIAESPIASIAVNPVTMVEFTGGWWSTDYNPETGEEEPYYRYDWWNHMSYTVTMKNGDTVTGNDMHFQYNGQEYELNGTDGQSASNPWTVGNTYPGTVNFGSISTEVSITIAESPVASIAISPITLTEHSDGWWNTDYNPETGTVEQYYRYGWWNNMTYTVTMKNGDTVTGYGVFFRYHGQEYRLEFSDGQSVSNPWTVGDTYTETVSFVSVSTEVSITIEESPVASIAVNPVTKVEFTGGWWDTEYNPETGTEESYYLYDWWNDMAYTVTMKNGDTVTGNGYRFEYNGQWYSVNWSINQSADNPWTAGNTYTGTVSSGSVSTEVSITIAESPVASIAVNPITVSEYTNGYWGTDWTEEGESGEYYHYEWWDYMSYTVTMKNGDTVTGNGLFFRYNGQEYELDYIDGQSVSNPWTVGNTYTGSISLGPVSTEVSITIEESPIASIAANPITLSEFTGGSWDTDDNPETGTEEQYYRYRWYWEMTYTVTMKNGDTVTGDGSGFSYNGQRFDVSCFDDQSCRNPWTAGNTYTGTVRIQGASAEVSITIEESPIASISVNPVTLAEFTGGGWSTDYNPETGTEEQYYHYEWWNDIEYTVTMKNGDTVTGYGVFFGYNGQKYELNVTDGQSVSNPWTAGDTYTGTVSFGSVSTEVSITIEESLVASIAVNPVTLTEFTGGWWSTDHNPETGTEERYYRYSWWNDMSYTVTMKNGDTVTGNDMHFQYNGQWYKLEFSDGQSANNPWTVGNTYPGTVSFGSVSTEVSITIEESPLESITVEPLHIPENTCGWWYLDYNPETGKEEEYYCYEWWDYMSYTVTMKNGETVTGTGTYFTYHGQEYAVEHEDIQSVSNPFLPGNTYVCQVNVGTIEAEVLVSIDAAVIEGGYRYSVQDGGAVITDCTLQDTVLVLPDTLGGYPVTGILSLGDALLHAEEIVVPDSVTMLSNGVFYKYEGPLKKLTLGSGISSFGLEQFGVAEKLEQIEVSPENPWYTSVDGVVYNKDITSMVMYPANKPNTHIIPDSVTDIDFLFHNAEYSEDGGMPEGYVGVSIQTGAGLTDYVTVDGVVYSADMTKIYSCVQEKTGTYVMPDTVTQVVRYAFARSALEHVTYSSSVTEIVFGTFYNNSSLTSITIPESVTRIGSCAFLMCSSLKSITFKGNAPTIGYAAFYEVTATAYYPADNATWTANVMQSYYGNITWVSYSTGSEPTPTEPEVTEPTVVIPSVDTNVPDNVEDVIEIPEDSEIDPTEAKEAADSLISSIGQTAQPENIGIESESNQSVIESAKENIKDENNETVNADSYKTSLKITVENLVVGTENEGAVVTTIVYDVTPHLYAVSSEGEVLGSTELHAFNTEVTFHLPVDKNTTATHAIVEHNGQKTVCPIQTDENGNKYVEVKSSEFSQFTVELHTHEYGQWQIVSAADATTSGLKQRVCSCGVVEEEVIPVVLKFVAATLSLDSSLAINFKINNFAYETYEDLYVIFDFMGRQTRVNCTGLDAGSTTRATFAFTGVAASWMAETVTATLYGTYNGEVVHSESVQYSVKQYCMNQLNKANVDAAKRRIYADLLLYGEAAQIFANYKTDDLASKDMTAEMRTWATPANFVPTLNDKSNSKHEVIGDAAREITFKSNKLVLESAIVYRLYFTAKGDISNYTFKVTTEGKNWTITSENFIRDEENDRYYINFAGMFANEMRKSFYITAFKGNTKVSNTVKYDIQSYVARNYNSQLTSDPKQAAMIRAMLCYGDSVDAVF